MVKGKKILSWPNSSIAHFNREIVHENPFINPLERGHAPFLRFAWDRRYLPLPAFSYEKFVETGKKLITLTEEYRGELQKDLLAYSGLDDETANLMNDREAVALSTQSSIRRRFGLARETPKQYSERVSTNFESMTELAQEARDRRKSLEFSSFTEDQYKSMSSCQLTLTDPKKTDSFMVVLDADKGKRRLAFYGQALSVGLFREMVQKFHRFGLTHYLSSGNP